MKSMYKQKGTNPEIKTFFNDNTPIDKRGAYKKVMKTYDYKLEHQYKGIDELLKSFNIDIDLEKEFEENSIKFFLTISQVSRLLSGTKYIEPLAYSAVVEAIAKKFEKDYELKFSVSELTELTEKLENLQKLFDEKKTDENEHPIEINSVFVKIADTEYECFRNKPSKFITHIDVLDDIEEEKEEEANDNREGIRAVTE